MKGLLRRAASLSVLIAMAFFLSSGAMNVRAEVISEIKEDAKSVGLSVYCDRQNQDALRQVTDNNQRTYLHAREELHIRFEASEPVKGLYFMFEKPCLWKLILPDGTEKQCGENEFLHEYIPLETETAGFEMVIPEECCLTEVYAFTEGNLPDWVQIWQPPCDRADLMLMPTHADDEHLWFGGAMPYYAGELGYKVQVVYLTNHYNATHRGHELLNGLWTVGVRNYPVITDKFLDDRSTKSSMGAAEAYFGRDRVLEFQVEMLRRFAPRVILAHDINGEYGHGAHKLNASTLLEALQIYEDPSVYPESAEKYGVTQVQKCYLHLWKENRITVSWSDKKLTRFGGKSAFDMAVEGYNCHKSQLRWSNYVLEYGAYDCRKFGLAYTTVGYDTPDVNDLFEHVDMSDPVEEPNVSVDISPSDGAAAVSDSDSGSGSYLNVCGIKVLKTDAAVALIAVIILLSGVIVVICLKRRQ